MARKEIFKGVVEATVTSNLAYLTKCTIILREKLNGIPEELFVLLQVQSPNIMMRKGDEVLMDLVIYQDYDKFWDTEIFYSICHRCFNKNLQTA